MSKTNRSEKTNSIVFHTVIAIAAGLLVWAGTSNATAKTTTTTTTDPKVKKNTANQTIRVGGIEHKYRMSVVKKNGHHWSVMTRGPYHSHAHHPDCPCLENRSEK